MALFIAQNFTKLIKNLVLALAIVSCHATVQKPEQAPVKSTQITLPSGKVLNAKLSVSLAEQTRGLSGVKAEDFPEDAAMLFVYPSSDFRRFWMPDTYFNLDIIFLDRDLKILDMERDVKAHPGYAEPPSIQRTREIFAQHVLEIKSNSSASKELKIGDVLRLPLGFSLSEIISKTHPAQ